MSQNPHIKIGPYLYTEADIIGKGSFGKVYKGKSMATGEVVAVKVINMGQDQSKHSVLLRMIKNEVEALKRVRNEYIVQFMDCIVLNNNVYIVTEFCNQADLRHLLAKQKLLQEKRAVELLRQIVKAFKELCRMQVMHRDLKPANVLLHNGVSKIADFGFAKTLDFSATDYNSHMVSIVGTPLYMSPQLLEKQKYTTKSDIWSMGIIFYEMLFSKVPWPGKDPQTYLNNIKSQKLVIDRTINNISLEAEDFLRKCLRVKEEDRIGWNELFEHPLINGTQISAVTTKDDSDSADSSDDGPEKHMKDYQTKNVNPSMLIKSYQSKILQASRSLLQSQTELTKTTIDQKLKNLNNMISSNLLRANLYAPNSRTFNMSFNDPGENTKSQNENFLHTNRFKASNNEGSRNPSTSPTHDATKLQKKASLKIIEKLEKDVKKISNQFNVMKIKAHIFYELYDCIKVNEIANSPLLKFNFLLVCARLVALHFKNISTQIMAKKIKQKSQHADDFYLSDAYKELVQFCETEKKNYEDLMKKTCRGIFDFGFSTDKEKDEALEYYQEICTEENEGLLVERIIDMSNQALYNINAVKAAIKVKDSNTSSKVYFEAMLEIFGDENLTSVFKTNKFDDLIQRISTIKEEFKNEKFNP